MHRSYRGEVEVETDAFDLGKEEDVKKDVAIHTPALYNMVDRH